PTETLNMFLGSRAIHESGSLASFISKSFQAPEIAEKLRTAAIEIYQRRKKEEEITNYFQSFNNENNQVTATRWSAILTGEITTFAILWAALHHTQIDSPSKSITSAIEWVKFNFEEKLRQALLNSQPKVLSSQENTELISSYIDSIGDIEQTLPGEDWELDEYLKKQPVETLYITSLHNSSASPAPPAPPAPSAPKSSLIQTWLINWLSKELKISQNTIDINKSFADYGIDSVIAVELAQDLQEWLNYPRAIEPTIAWNFPTIESLSNYLAQTLVQETSTENQSEEIQLPTEDSSELDSMSDVELAELLAAEINTVKGSGNE
ncbi:MAG: acyl carrier protein, partial [Cyanobacteria bacterium P01_A01_bin.80]